MLRGLARQVKTVKCRSLLREQKRTIVSGHDFALQHPKPNRPLNVLYFGSSDVAVPALQELSNARSPGYGGQDMPLIGNLEVVVPPLKTKAGKFSLTASDVELAAENLGLPTHRMGQDVNFRMTGYERPPGDFDIGVIISFGHLIRPDIIESFPLGMINAHASLLPQLKGAAPMQYALMNGLERTGVSITTLHPTSIDAGRVLHQSSFDIAPGTTFASMVPTVAQHAADDIIHVLRDWDAVAERSREQAELVELHGAVPKELRRAPKIGKALGKVEWANMTAREAVCRWQGLTGFTPVYTSFKNKRCQLLEMRVAEGPMPEQLADAPPGTAVLSQDKSALLVRCREGVAAVGEVQLECKKPSVAAQFANGYMKTVTTVLFGDQQ